MPNLSDKKESSRIENLGNKGRGNYLKLKDGHNFVLLLSDKYQHGFAHWFLIGDKTIKRTCKAGLEYDGWDPDSCEGCAVAAEQYELKKEAKEDGNESLAEDYNKKGNKLRANYQFFIPAALFKTLILKKGRDSKGKPVYEYKPDYDEVEVGLLQLTQAQTKKLFAIKNDSNFPQIVDDSYLAKFLLDFVKEKEGDKKYAELKEIRVAKKEFSSNNFSVEEEDIPELDDDLFKEAGDMAKIVEAYKEGSLPDSSEEYEEQDLDKKDKKGDKSKKSKSKKADDDDF